MQYSDDPVDPEIRVGLDALLSIVGAGGISGIDDLDERRKKMEELTQLSQSSQAPNDRVEHEDRVIPGLEDQDDIRVRIYRPAGKVGRLPGLYFIHGGGLNAGTIETEHSVAVGLTDMVGCVTVAVDYRLAPEDPYPASLEDCYSGLLWTAESADEIGVDPNRLAIYGGSAGGGLAAATAIAARDRGGPPLVFQALIYPMLDDRGLTPSNRELTELKLGVWDGPANASAWHDYLGEMAGTAEVPGQAAPAREKDLSGLPPTYMDVGQLDLFRDEGIDYASRLMRAGIPTELHVYPGAVHGSEFLAPDSELGRRVIGYRSHALRRAFDLVASESSPSP
ncbi:MAG: alpha/beta hydrolase [Solirubrobacterales bacterium]